MQIGEQDTKHSQRNLSTSKDNEPDNMKIEDKIKKLKFKGDYRNKHNSTTIEDMPPDPLIRRTMIPTKIAKFAKIKKYM